MTTVLHFIPTLEGGGAERQLAYLAREHARRGIDVHIGLRRRGVHAEALAGSGVHLHDLGEHSGIHPGLIRNMHRLVKDVRPTVIQTWLISMDIVGGSVATLYRIPWILSERSSADFYRSKPLAGWVRRQIARCASAVVANSNAGGEYWTQSLRSSARIFTIRNALAPQGIQVASDYEAASKSPGLLLVVGRFSEEKAHEIIVRAAALAPQAAYRLAFIGTGPLQDDIARAIAEQGVAGRVSIEPYDEVWWERLKSADGLISMSRFEGNPNVVLEAVAGHCPVILSDIQAHREIADDTTALFVPVDDAAALSRAISAHLADPAAARARAGRARRRTDALTIESAADAYLRVYEEVQG